MLQWGHERALVEMRPKLAHPIAAVRLQWGHERALVEILYRRHTEFLAAGLQWGHERALVEINPLAPRKRCLCASMGPRARARGNSLRRKDLRAGGALQWGHERALVEMP